MQKHNLCVMTLQNAIASKCSVCQSDVCIDVALAQLVVLQTVQAPRHALQSHCTEVITSDSVRTATVRSLIKPITSAFHASAVTGNLYYAAAANEAADVELTLSGLKRASDADTSNNAIPKTVYRGVLEIQDLQITATGGKTATLKARLLSKSEVRPMHAPVAHVVLTQVRSSAAVCYAHHLEHEQEKVACTFFTMQELQ